MGTSFGATRFLLPLGLPMVTNAQPSYDSLPIAAGASSLDPARFHGNIFDIKIDDNPGAPRGALAGGGANDQAAAGRYTLDVANQPSAALPLFGMRCALPAE
jgi:hypothetical protein